MHGLRGGELHTKMRSWWNDLSLITACLDQYWKVEYIISVSYSKLPCLSTFCYFAVCLPIAISGMSSSFFAVYFNKFFSFLFVKTWMLLYCTVHINLGVINCIKRMCIVFDWSEECLDRVTPSQMPCIGTEIALCWYRSIRKCAPIFDEYALDRASYQRWPW